MQRYSREFYKFLVSASCSLSHCTMLHSCMALYVTQRHNLYSATDFIIFYERLFYAADCGYYHHSYCAAPLQFRSGPLLAGWALLWAALPWQMVALQRGRSDRSGVGAGEGQHLSRRDQRPAATANDANGRSSAPPYGAHLATLAFMLTAFVHVAQVVNSTPPLLKGTG